ncbi:hypothetical protein OAV22_02050 [Flavobacteriaceae bacterium]|nr:hypothetical protein [Flavobacteriaceae bacterium]
MKTFIVMPNQKDENEDDLASFYSNLHKPISVGQVFEFDVSTGNDSPMISNGDTLDFDMVKHACQTEKTNGWVVEKSYITISSDGALQIITLKPIKQWSKK